MSSGMLDNQGENKGERRLRASVHASSSSRTNGGGGTTNSPIIGGGGRHGQIQQQETEQQQQDAGDSSSFDFLPLQCGNGATSSYAGKNFSFFSLVISFRILRYQLNWSRHFFLPPPTHLLFPPALTLLLSTRTSPEWGQTRNILLNICHLLLFLLGNESNALNPKPSNNPAGGASIYL